MTRPTGNDWKKAKNTLEIFIEVGAYLECSNLQLDVYTCKHIATPFFSLSLSVMVNYTL